MSTIIKSNEKRKNFIVKQILKKIDFAKDKNKVVGIYGLSMKTNSDNVRESSVLDITNRLIKLGVKVIVYENKIDINSKLNLTLVNDLAEFKNKADLIIANRVDSALDDVIDKTYSRDIFSRD